MFRDMRRFISIATVLILFIGLIMPTANVAKASDNPFKITGIPDNYTVDQGNVEILEVNENSTDSKKYLNYKSQYSVSNDGTLSSVSNTGIESEFQLPTDIQDGNDYVVRVTLNLRTNDDTSTYITYVDETNYKGDALKALTSIAWDKEVVSVSYAKDDSLQSAQVVLTPLNNTYNNYYGYWSINENSTYLLNPQKVRVLFQEVKDHVVYSLFKDVNVTGDTKISFAQEIQSTSLKKVEIFKGEQIYPVKNLRVDYGDLILCQDSRHRFSTALSLGGLHKKV